ncbi:MAG: SRPBCC family protein [Flavobacteriales bacterium]|nr:SRPBCC family protein [Flavobacteriales bacterium]
MTTFKKQITVNASKQKVWDVLSDLGGVMKFHPGVKKSYYTTDQTEGIGAARICELAPMGKIEETAVSWKDGESYTLKIDPIEKAPPVKDFLVEILLIEKGANQVVVSFNVSYDMKLGFIGTLLNKIVIRSQMETGITGLLQGMKIYAEKGTEIKDNSALKKLLKAA